jgi:hypothetical protein
MYSQAAGGVATVAGEHAAVPLPLRNGRHHPQRGTTPRTHWDTTPPTAALIRDRMLQRRKKQIAAESAIVLEEWDLENSQTTEDRYFTAPGPPYTHTHT